VLATKRHKQIHRKERREKLDRITGLTGYIHHEEKRDTKFFNHGLTQIDADYFRQDNSLRCEQRQDAVRQAGVLGNLAILKILLAVLVRHRRNAAGQKKSRFIGIPLLLCEVATSLRSTSFSGRVSPVIPKTILQHNYTYTLKNKLFSFFGGDSPFS
jgi:hypothetical protein